MEQGYMAGQGSIVPKMFIGMGGVGSRIVDRIAGHAKKLVNWKSQLRDLTSFISIDTNELDQHKLTHIPMGNRINIAAFDKVQAIEGFRRSKDMQALQWLDQAYKPRSGYKPGAGQIRIESRLGFFYNSPEIQKRMRQIINQSLSPGNTWRQSYPRKYYVYLFCSLAGGTGSGSFLSTAYLIQKLINEVDWQPRVIGNFLLSTLLLDKVGPELHSDIHANSYAALKELEHLTKLDYAQIKREHPEPERFVYVRDENNPELPTVVTRPFFLGFIFDRPGHVSLAESEPAIADAAFLQIFTPLIDNLAGELDNYEKKMEGLTRFPGELKNVGRGYSKNFGAFGAAVLVLPGEQLLDYCAFRFAAQAIRSQITFGIDPSNAADDRTRALARLAVDYSDPKFLRMSDDAREEVINRAFMDSVREMARQDEREELLDGFWFRLAESVDQGPLTGHDPQGEPIRGESDLQRVARTLEVARKDLLGKVSIKERAFVFHKEGVNQYPELVNRLLEDIRTARLAVDEGLKGIETAAAEGEVVTDLKLDPIKERYLALRLLEACNQEWIPQAEQQFEKASKEDVFANPKVREKLEQEEYELLREAAGRRKLFGRDEDFENARDQAQDGYRKTAQNARKLFEAEVKLRQLRALRGYLVQRSRQYARLATHMDHLVQELESEAEKLRKGEGQGEAGLTLRVEVFETLDEPRRRMWDRVYQRLFIDDGRSLSTFDRNVLAAAISEQLKPEVKKGGLIVPKPVNTIVQDLRRTLFQLGQQRLKPAILGGGEEPGLDLSRGLQMEAELVLSAKSSRQDDPTPDEVEEYLKKKFRALSQQAGVLARVNTVTSQAWDDGVVVNRTRQLIIGGRNKENAAYQKLCEKLKAALSLGDRQVKTDDWPDPRMAIVHDVEMPIPLYYFPAVNGEVEGAYLISEADERRAYALHTDFRWEKTLPNLNPHSSEISVSWSLEKLAEGLLTGVVDVHDDSWLWLDGKGKEPYTLGEDLSAALYKLSDIHQHEDLNPQLEASILRARRTLGRKELSRRGERLCQDLEEMIGEIGKRDLKGSSTREDALDRPVLKVLREVLKSLAGETQPTVGAAQGRYRFGGGKTSRTRSKRSPSSPEPNADLTPSRQAAKSKKEKAYIKKSVASR